MARTMPRTMARTMVRTIGLIVALLIAAIMFLVASYFFIGGRAGLVSTLVPFPEQPTPQTQLTAESTGDILFASATPFDFDVLIGDMSHATATTGTGHLFLPDNASIDAPVPAVVLVHGSGGISPGREMEHGKMLARQGYAAFVINYYLPRGATPDLHYMLRVISVTEFDAISDAYHALKLLRTHPLINGDKVAIAGFSYGGMAARFAMDDRIRVSLFGDAPGFAAHVDVYGPCFQQLNSPKLSGGPLLTLRGTDDNSNDLDACKEREAEISATGTLVETHIYAGAGHAWDNHSERSLRPDSPYLRGCTVSYDERGHSSINGQPIVDLPIETSREERIAHRILGSGPSYDCLEYGYIVGRDDKTRIQADAAMLEFLDKYLK